MEDIKIKNRDEMKMKMKMKRITGLLLALFMTMGCLSLNPIASYADDNVSGGVPIDREHFPDRDFRFYVHNNFDLDGDQELSPQDIEKIESIDVGSIELSNLKGIEYFKNLKELYCYNNKLRSLDLSNNPKLEVLDCSNNKLRSLDLSNNPKLTELDCSGNHLTELNLSNNPKLTELKCNNNYLSSLDLSNNPKLTKLDCHKNYLSSLDLRNNIELTELDCNNNWLRSLNLSNNKNLTSLNCSNNDLPSLDLSNNTKLSNLNCGNQQYNIVLKGTKEFKYSNFPGKFDKEKVKSLVGASLGDDALIVNDDNPREVTYKYKFSNSVEMNVKLTVGYIEFDPERIASAKVITQPTLSYAEGDRLDLTGLEVTLADDQGLKKNVPFAELGRYNITATPENGTFLTVVDHNCKPVKLTFSIPGVPMKFYLGQTGILTVKKFDPTNVKSMSVTHQPTRLTYTEGENLDLTGLEVTLEDANHVKKVVTPAEFEANGIKATPKNGKKLALTDNEAKVKLTKDGVPSVETGKLTVEELHPTSMSVTSQPNKLSYTEGENLDLTGLEVTLEDNNHVKKVVTSADFTANNIMATPENGKKLELTDGGKPVKLTRGNLTAETGALQVKQQSSGSGSAGGAGVGAGSSTGHGSSAGVNDDAPATLDNGELNIQIDGAESDYKPGYAGDGFSNANAGNAGNANAGSAPEVKQPDADVKQSADTLALAQAQVDAAARKLADARKSQSEAPAPKLQTVTPAPKSQSEKPAPKPQSEKRIGMIPKTDKSASFAGLIALYAGLIAVLGFSIAGLAIFRKKKMMEENIK
ncbi:leucine-rich repeat domain-containing protein [Gardnerella sp. KA00603]|uniref:leucine-rich repeat domain-containing protein n=1 Tax=Gardnerella sp. KA00603 TaxID=2749076 RepID=UPI003BAB3235